MQYIIIGADGRHSKRYPSEEAATRALARRKEVGSAVVWVDDTGKPKVWCGYWGRTRWDQVAPSAESVMFAPGAKLIDDKTGELVTVAPMPRKLRDQEARERLFFDGWIVVVYSHGGSLSVHKSHLRPATKSD